MKPKRPAAVRDAIRQLRHPEAWRIPSAHGDGSQPDDGPHPKKTSLSVEQMALLSARAGRLIVALGTAIWRMHRRLTTDNAIDDALRVRGAIRHAEAALDAVKSDGLTIRDYVGERWKPGLEDVSVLSREPDPRPEDTVIQAQRPAILLEGMQFALQRAEVVLSDPMPGIAGSAVEPPPETAERSASSDDSPPHGALPPTSLIP